MSSKDLGMCGKYAKLAVFATMAEPKSLSELGLFWHGENGRFYKPKARKEIDAAIEDRVLIRHGPKLGANMDELLSCIYKKVKNDYFKSSLLSFWHHSFTRSTYLCAAAIRQLFRGNAKKAAEADISLVFSIPLALHRLQERDTESYSLFVSMWDLDTYTSVLNTASERNISRLFKNMAERIDWLNTLNRIIRAKDNFFQDSGLKIRDQMVKK